MKRSPLPRIDADGARRLYAAGESIEAIAKVFGCHERLVARTVTRPAKTRTRISPVSERGRFKAERMRAATILLVARDGRTCRLARCVGTCQGPLSFHHLRKQSAGGTEDIGNGVLLCQAHQTAVEDAPDRAHQLGLVARFGDLLDDCWQRMHAAGLAERPEPSPAPVPDLSEERCEACGRRGVPVTYCDGCEAGMSRGNVW